jgi:hypothetical protein
VARGQLTFIRLVEITAAARLLVPFLLLVAVMARQQIVTQAMEVLAGMAALVVVGRKEIMLLVAPVTLETTLR